MNIKLPNVFRGLFLTFCFIMLALSFELIYDLATAINSDLIYIDSIYRDIFIRDYPLSGWLVSKAPYCFPDWFVYSLLRALSGNYITAWYLYIIFDFSFLLGFFYYTARYFFKNSWFKDLFFTLIWGAVFILLLNFTPDGYGSHTLLLPVYHSGALINGLVIFGFWYRSLLTPLSSKQLYALTLFSLVASFSDLWWVIWFGIPIGLVTLILVFNRKLAWRGNIFFLCAMGIGVVFGDLIGRLIERQGWLQFSHVPVGVRANPYLKVFKLMVRDILDLFISSPVLGVLFFSTIVLCIIAIISWGYKKRCQALRPHSLSEDKSDTFVAIHMVVFLSFIIPFFPIVFFQMWEQWNYRYLHHFIFLPWMMVGLYLFELRSRNTYTKKLFKLTYFLPLVLFVFLFTVAKDSSMGGSRRGIPLAWTAPYYPQEIACFDEVVQAYNLQFGISEYWDAKRITEISKAGALINQFTYNLDPLVWMNNSYWYKNRDPDNKKFIQYDFVITNNDPNSEFRKNTLRFFGPPSEDILCGVWHILIYKGDKKVQLNKFIGVKLVKVFSGVEDMVEYGENHLLNGDFELPNLSGWQYTAANGSATFKRIPFESDSKNIPGNPKYYARWQIDSPADYAFLEQHFSISDLAGKELGLVFWARTPDGEKKFTSYGYFLPHGLLDKTARHFQPSSGGTFTLNNQWQKIVVAYSVPAIGDLALTDSSYALIRPIFFADTDTTTIDIAHARLVTWGEPVTQIEEGYLQPIVTPKDIKALIVKADKSHEKEDSSEEFRYLKQAQILAFGNYEILWRLARLHKTIAIQSNSSEEESANLVAGATYAWRAYKLVNNSKTNKWWGIMASELGRLEGTKQRNIGAEIFADCMKEAILLEPDDAELHALMGQWYFDWAAPDSGVWLRSKLLLSSMPRGSFAQARAFFARAVELEPNNIPYRISLSKTLIKLNNQAAAIEQLQAALSFGEGSNYKKKQRKEAYDLLNSLH